LGARVDLILDGGPCEVGVESTVLDVSGARPVILRPGGVSWEEIEKLIGKVNVIETSVAVDEAAASPGMQAVHYSPATPTYRFEVGDGKKMDRGLRAAALLYKPEPLPAEVHVIQMPPDAKAYAQRLYAALHEADGKNAAAIWVQMPPDEPAWLAVRDRIKRASKHL
jgi:L-threonylcarbamoyladenylate synthase